MTALNVIVQASAVHLLTDCAGYDTSGRMISLASKVTVAPEWRAAFACSGRADSVRLSEAMAARRPVSQASALSALPGVMRELREQNRRRHPDDEDRNGDQENGLQVVCAIFSDRTRRPEAWIISSDQAYLGDGYRPYTFVQIRELFSPDLDPQDVLARPCCPTDEESFSPSTDGLAVLEAQRQSPWPDGLFYVGGAAQLTSVSAAGVAVDILRHWPDAVGQRIAPVDRSSIRVPA